MGYLSKQAGFTLIEVMVSLFIFAVGVAALVSAQTNSLNTTAALADRGYAEIVAENILVETVTSIETIELGYTYGEEVQRGRRYAWARNIRETGQETIQWVEVQVRLAAPEGANQNDNPVLFTLNGFRREL